MHADLAAELPVLCLALEAEFVVRNVVQPRTIKAAGFFLIDLTTAIAPVALLVNICFHP